jgi:hypothetical protein
MQEELQICLVHLIGLGERKRLSDEACQTLTQGVVPPLHMGQLSTLLAYRLVALLGDYRPVCLPKIAVATSSFVAFGNSPPQPATSSLAPLADYISEHLTAVSSQGDPYPGFIGFLANERPQLVEFEHESF